MGQPDVLRAHTETDTTPGLSTAQVEFDVGYGIVTHEGLGLLTTYGGVSMLGPDRHGIRLGGRIELGAWVDLSVEGERTTQDGDADHQVALYGHLGWWPTAEPLPLLRRDEKSFAPTPPIQYRIPTSRITSGAGSHPLPGPSACRRIERSKGRGRRSIWYVIAFVFSRRAAWYIRSDPNDAVEGCD